MQKCAIIGYRKELTITEYSLTTSTKNELQNPEGKKSVLGITSAW